MEPPFSNRHYRNGRDRSNMGRTQSANFLELPTAKPDTSHRPLPRRCRSFPVRPIPLLAVLLATAVVSPAFSQEKPKAPDTALIALGGISSAYMFESHQKIGYIIEAYAAKSIDLVLASKDLGATRSLLGMIDKQLTDLAEAVKFTDGDIKTFEDIRGVLKTEVKSIDSILGYWKDKKDDDLKAYRTHRTAAWRGIATQLNLGVADKKAMQGTWSATKAGSDGDDAPEADLKEILFVIKDDVITFSKGKDSSAAKMVLNMIANPNQLDAEVLDGPSKGKTRLGIYEIKGDVLKLCWSRGDKRPTKFSSEQGPDVINFELKRAKE